MELHIWGPAFSLPSIDPECLAVIAYLQKAVLKDEWFLVASSDTALSPTKDLPVLIDGKTTVGGFQNILDHLHHKSSGKWNLGVYFEDPQTHADIVAFSSHILTSFLPLLDLSLYVSSENYSHTRSAYTPIVPWPTQYYIPLSRRSSAKARTEYTGLSTLDLDTVDDKEDKRRKLDDLIPNGLRTSKKTLTGLLKEKGSGKRFRLDGLVDVACEPLAQLLGKKRYMLSDERPSSLDCLALGYLSLALLPKLPQRWLAEGMEARYPELCSYVRRGVEDCFGGEVKVEDARLGSIEEQASKTGKTLPWQAPERQGVSAAGKALLHATTNSISFHETVIVNAPPEKVPATASASSSVSFPATITAATAIAAVTSYFLYASTSAETPERQRLSDMGEAGAIFTDLDFGRAQAKGTDKILQQQGKG